MNSVKCFVKKIPAFVTRNINGTKVLNRRFHKFRRGLLLTDIAVDKNKRGRGSQELRDVSRRGNHAVTAVQETHHQTRTFPSVLQG